MSLVAYYPLNGNFKDIISRNDLNIKHIYGDVNGDGLINQTDLDLVDKHVKGTSLLTAEQQKRADLDENGKVTLADYSKLLAYTKGTLTNAGIIGKPVIYRSNRIEPTWAEGKTGRYALKLNNYKFFTNKVYIEQLRNKPLNFSVSLWIKQEIPNQDFMNIITFDTHKESDNSIVQLRLESTANPYLKWYNNGHLSHDSGYNTLDSNCPINEWIHLVSVFSSTGVTFYRNGKQTASWSYQNSPEGITLTGSFHIGTTEGIPGDKSNWYSNSTISDIKIYDHCLSKEEAYQDYLSPMLHYTFEQPYAEETENMPHELLENTNNGAYINISFGTDDKGDYFIKTPKGVSSDWASGIWLRNNTVYGGNYYTWSIEVNPDIDLIAKDNYAVLSSELDKYIWFDRNISPTSTWVGNDAGCTIIDSYTEDIPKNTWTRIWITVYVDPAVGKAELRHALCPNVTSGQVKCYYRNSQLEKKDHMTPYTRDKREGQVIRDKSGMGNDGVVKYKREEIPIIQQLVGNAGSNDTLFYDSNTNTWTFNPENANNYTYTLGKMNYNSRYHYKDSIISYEFDLELKNITKGSDPRLWVQGTTVFKDNTFIWQDSPVCAINLETNNASGGDFDLTMRVRNLTNGAYHITLQHKINPTAREGASSVGSNVSYYELGLRFDYVKGTVIMKNLHAYYQSLDTSTLGITDRNNAVGTHSAHFNGKSYIDCGIVTPDEMDELTLSCWVYQNDWSNSTFNKVPDPNKGCQTLIGNNYSGRDTDRGFGLKFEKGLNNLNFPILQGNNWSPNCLVNCSTLSPGWHMFTGVANKNRKAIYIDGELKKEVVHNLNHPIKNVQSDRKKFYIAHEYRDYEYVTSGTGSTERGGNSFNLLDTNLDDVRLYPIALTDEEVKALYHTKAKIDKDSNMYTNQSVETKRENLASLSKLDVVDYFHLKKYPSFSYNNKILKIYNMEGDGSNVTGVFLRNKFYGGKPISGKRYKFSLDVRVSRAGVWNIGDEASIVSVKYMESGKWYHFSHDVIAHIRHATNFVFYYKDGSLQLGDTIEIKDFKFYRIDDDLLPIERDTDPKITKKAQIKGFELNEIDYDRLTKRQNIIEKDGAKWVEVFYHNTNNNTEWFADEAEALHCTSQYKYSRLDCLEQYRQADGKFEFLLEYPIEHPGQFNRWKQTDNPTKVQESNGALIPANGYEAIHIDWSSGFGGLLKHKGIMHSNEGVFTLLDGSTNHNHFFYSVGCYNNTGKDSLEIGAWADKVPGPSLSGGIDNQVVTEIRLYARINDEQINLGPTIINKYGAQWLEVFYHNNHSGTVVFKDKEEAMHCVGNKDKYSILDCLEQYRGKDNKFEFLLKYPTELPGQYNRWKQIDNPAEVKEVINNLVATGYEAIHIDWDGNDTGQQRWGGLLKSLSANTLIDGSVGHGNWHWAIGCVVKWASTDGNPGIPGPELSGVSSMAYSEDVCLYVRIDNIDNRQQIAKLTKLGIIKTKEIKEV